MAGFDYSASFSGINNALANIGKQNDVAWLRNAQADVGKSLQTGDYAGAAQKAFGYGDAQTGLGLLKLGEAAKDRASDAALIQGLPGFGGAAGQPLATLGKPAAIGTPNEVENNFVNTVKSAGLTNPAGLGAVAAYGKAESGYNPGNVNRSWSDPSQSGQPGQAGGIMSWRADRLQNLQRFAASRGEQGNGSPQTQALFLAQEDPTLIPKLQAAKSPEEANQIMAQAWRFAGYNQPGGENARRLALTQGYAQRFGGQGGPAPAVPVQVAENEADVQRLEAQQGNPVVDAPGPVQVAQAAPQPGAPVSDVPAAGAAETQFVIPGTNTTVDQQTLSSNPRIQNMVRALAAARTEKAQAAIKQALELEVADAKTRMDQGGPLAREKARLENAKLRQEVEGDGARPMTPDERKAYSVPDGQAAYIKKNGDPGFGPAGTIIKNEPAPEKGYRYVRDANGNIERSEPIPGSEAATKAAEAEKKATLRQQYSETTGNAVINALNDVDRLMKSATLPTTGAMGARLAGIPGTAAHDIANALTTVGGNITIENLNQMRQASPTGGALGAVSDQEGAMLRNAWGSLQQSQTEEQFKTNLGRVRAIFERVVHGRTLTPKEREIGGPMTVERAKGLRDDAAAAIASGAPRDEVIKRLKDHYGISTDGL